MQPVASPRSVVSVNYLELNRLKLPKFFIASSTIAKQLESAEDLIDSRSTTSFDFKSAYSISRWKSREAMNNFFRSGAHAKEMQKAGEYSICAVTSSFEWGSDRLPTLREAVGLLRKHGKKVMELNQPLYSKVYGNEGLSISKVPVPALVYPKCIVATTNRLFYPRGLSS